MCFFRDDAHEVELGSLDEFAYGQHDDVRFSLGNGRFASVKVFVFSESMPNARRSVVVR